MPPLPSDKLALNVIAEEVLTCACAALATTAEGCPACRHVVDGIPAWDNCCEGQLTTHIRRVYPSEVFPAQALVPFQCQKLGLVVELVVTILRCADTPCVCCDGIENRSAVVHEDAYAIWTGVACCIATWNGLTTRRQGALVDQTFLGPDGGCAGSETVVLIGLPCVCCPAPPGP